ncbi:hypothetical protein V8V91_14645 [Algoriphagus halophilus]|uniref:hypothetical protein n=1 Tax=Algoriphagus halophilus TaxID=226505 RepID=UPI00358E58AE
MRDSLFLSGQGEQSNDRKSTSIQNLYKAYRQVVGNKGLSGVDGMQVTELKSFIDQGKTAVLTDILKRRACT